MQACVSFVREVSDDLGYVVVVRSQHVGRRVMGIGGMVFNLSILASHSSRELASYLYEVK